MLSSSSSRIVQALILALMACVLAACVGSRMAKPVDITVIADKPTSVPVNVIIQSTTPAPIDIVTFTVAPSSVPSLLPSATFIASPSPDAIIQPFTKTSHKDGMVLIYIPAGEFWLGSSDSDLGADPDEKPRHRVYLDDYWIDKTEVTNAMFAAFLSESGNQDEGGATWYDTLAVEQQLVFIDGQWKPGNGYEDHPAVEITWYGARAYCEWAGRRLPTEAEWEKAARTSMGSIYPWGEGIDCTRVQYANCGGKTLPVGSKPAGSSPYGVLDMSGNVWEWVADWYSDSYYTETFVSNPIGPEQGIARVLRGGSYDYDWKHVRSANRRNNGPATSINDYGFRCVLPGNEFP